MRYYFLLTRIVAVGLMLIAAVACATATPAPTSPLPTAVPPTNVQPATATTAAASTSDFVGEISFYINEGADELGGFEQLVETFEARHPNAKVALVNIPDDDQFDQKIAALFAANTAPDVININYRRFGQFAIKGVLQPVNEYLAQSKVVHESDYYAEALDAFKFKGVQYCIPQNISSLEVYYNKSLFEKAKLTLPSQGWTWDEFLKDAQALTQDTNGDGKTDQYGLGIAPSMIRLAPFIWAHGGEVVDNVDKPTKLLLDTPASLEAFQWFVDLQNKHHVIPNKADEATEPDQSRFEHGTMGMYLNSRVETPELRETIEDKFEWDVAPMPSDVKTATVLHSDGYCISKGSQHKELAWAFTEFANGPEGETLLVRSGRTVPSLQSVAESNAFLEQAEPPASSRIYLDMVPYVRRVPVATTWLEVEGFVSEEIKRAFYGDATVQEAADAAVKGTTEYFRQNLKDLSEQ